MSTSHQTLDTPADMKAARLHAPGSPMSIDLVPVPRPASGQVLVKVLACGLCGSDVHMWHGRVPVGKTPIVLGHEIAGAISTSGDAVGGWREGDLVIVRAGAGCGRCPYCTAGRDNLCPQQRVLGMDEDGGFAQYVVAPTSSLVPLPPSMPPEVGAILTDAVATPYHALTERGRLKRGESVVVFGAGGVGAHAVLLAKALGASPVVAVDIRPAALARAKALGADEAVPADDAPAKAVQRITGGADLALDCVGKPESIAQAVRSLKPGGRAVVVGMGQQPISLPPPALFAWREHSLIGSFGSTSADLDAVISMTLEGQLDLSQSITGRVPLSAIDQTLALLEDPTADHIRIVILPWEEV